jgi:hypothetical protein
MSFGYPNGAAAPTDVLSEKAGFAPQTATGTVKAPKIACHYGNNIFAARLKNKHIPQKKLQFFDILGFYDKAIVYCFETMRSKGPISECGDFVILRPKAFVRNPDPIAGRIGDCIRRQIINQTGISRIKHKPQQLPNKAGR